MFSNCRWGKKYRVGEPKLHQDSTPLAPIYSSQLSDFIIWDKVFINIFSIAFYLTEALTVFAGQNSLQK